MLNQITYVSAELTTTVAN